MFWVSGDQGRATNNSTGHSLYSGGFDRDGGNIQLTFVSFDVEYESSCGYDYVEVSYGDYSERFCGGENEDYLPGPFTSCGSSITKKKFSLIIVNKHNLCTG